MRVYITILIFLSFFISNISLASKQDCSGYKKLSKEYLKCKASNLKSATSKIGLDTSNIKEKKYLVDWFKKKE